MIYETYTGYWWRCRTCGEYSDQFCRYSTKWGAKRGLKKHIKTHAKEKNNAKS